MLELVPREHLLGVLRTAEDSSVLGMDFKGVGGRGKSGIEHRQVLARGEWTEGTSGRENGKICSGIRHLEESQRRKGSGRTRCGSCAVT